MSDDEINEVITEATGLWDHPYSSDTKRMYDFCSDLNAMHQAEKTIYNHNNLWTAYYYQIGAGPFSLHATARKKAEAFLRIHGKWKEVQK